jgi:hypothetical protein
MTTITCLVPDPTVALDTPFTMGLTAVERIAQMIDDALAEERLAIRLAIEFCEDEDTDGELGIAFAA